MTVLSMFNESGHLGNEIARIGKAIDARTYNSDLVAGWEPAEAPGENRMTRREWLAILLALVVAGLWLHPYRAQQASRYALPAAGLRGPAAGLEEGSRPWRGAGRGSARPAGGCGVLG